MKIVQYKKGSESLRLGILQGNQVLDPQIILEEKLMNEIPTRASQLAHALLPDDTVSFIANGTHGERALEEALQYAKENEVKRGVYSLDEVELGSPITRPGKIICVGLNYRDHIEEMKRDLPAYPVLFAKFANTIVGPNDQVPLRTTLTQKLDYEAELAFVVGKTARNVTKEEALEYVYGYTVANDITHRDMQKRTIQWLQGKSVEGSLPLGPYLVTSDEIEDPHNLSIQLKVNGEVRQKSNTENLVFTVNILVEFLSQIMTLEPGDVVCTGTPGGVGEAQGKFLKDGDVVTVEISGLGLIENVIKQID